MYEFLATATDRQGHRSTRVVKANKSHEAVAQLEAEGCTDILLHTDDAGAASSNVSQDDLDGITPEDMLDFRAMSTFGLFLFILKNCIYSFRWLAALSMFYIVYTLYNDYPLGIFFYTSVVVLLAPVGIAFYFSFLSSSHKYSRLMESWAWGRWDDVLELAEELRGQIPDLELDSRMAVALAKTGEYEAGLETISQYADDPETPRWMYLARLSEFYFCAGEVDLAVEASREAYDEDPDNPTVEFDYALTLLKLDRNLDEARRLLDAVEQKHLSDLLMMFIPFGRGLIALNSGYYADARELFLEARERLLPLAAEPLVRQVIDYNSAYLAIACAHSGETTEALKHYRPAKKRLVAFGANLLLARLEAAMEKHTAVDSFQA